MPAATGRRRRGAEPVAVPGQLPVGERLRRLRLERGMSQADLGGERLSKGFISQLESGRSRPSPESLEYLARRLDVPLSALMPQLEVAQARAFLLRACAAALEAGRLEEGHRLLDELGPMVTAAPDVGRTHRMRAELLEKAGRLDAALAEALLSVDAAAGAADAEEAARCCNVAGRLHFRAGRYPAALAYIHQAHQQASRPGVPPALRARLLVNEGQLHLVLGDDARAMACFTQASAAAEDAEDLAELAGAAMALGETARRIGDLPAAIAQSERALVLYERLEQRRLAASIVHNIGEALVEGGRVEEGREHMERALEAMRALGDRVGQGYCMERLAALLAGRGEAARARELASGAAGLARDVDDQGLLAMALASAAEASAAAGDATAVRREFEEAVATAAVARRSEHMPLSSLQRTVLLRAGAAMRRIGDDTAAADYFERAARRPG